MVGICLYGTVYNGRPKITSFNPTLESSESAIPPEGYSGSPGHSPQLQPLNLLSHPCNNITRTLISS